MPDLTYELDLTAKQVNDTLNDAHDSLGPPISGSSKLVQSGTLFDYIQQEVDGKVTIIHSNTIYVSKNGSNSRVGKDDHDFSKPFLTVFAANTQAVAGDTIVVFPGDYTPDSAVNLKDGVNYVGLEGAILPSIFMTNAGTAKGSGLCDSITTNNLSAVLDMPNMHAVGHLLCAQGTMVAGNAGTYIECAGSGSTQTVGNAGTHILCNTGGIQTAGNAGSFIKCTSGSVQVVGTAGEYYSIQDDATATIYLRNQSHDGGTDPPIYLEGASTVRVYGDSSTSTQSGGAVVELFDDWSGNLFIDGLTLRATTVDTNEATKGIVYGADVTGSVQLKDCSIITAQNGTGVAEAISAPSEQTVYIQGTLSVTHDVSLNISLSGGDIIINSNFV